MPKKTKRGDPLGFFNIHYVAKQQKIEEGPFGEKFFRKKSLAVPKKIERGDPLVSPNMVLRGKTGKTFLVQFAGPNGAIRCNNTLKELFWSVRVN